MSASSTHVHFSPACVSLFKDFYFCVCVCALHVGTVLDLPESELQMVVGHLMCVLGTDPKDHARAANIPNC